MDDQPPQNIADQDANKADENMARFLKLPSYVLDWLFSPEAAENIAQIAKQFNISQEKNSLLARINAFVVLKDISLDNLPMVLEKNLQISQDAALKMTMEIAAKQFLPIRNHVSGVENFIAGLGGQLPNPLPPMHEDKKQQIVSTAQEEQDMAIEQDIASMVALREDIINQNITEKPLKLADSDSPKLPNIKNWITDYKKYKASFPAQDIGLIRTKYLHDSPNGKNLSENERIIVSHLLKSLDEYTRLPFSQKTGRLLVEKLTQSSQIPQGDPLSTNQAPSSGQRLAAYERSLRTAAEPVDERPLQPPVNLPTPPVPQQSLPQNPPVPSKLDTYREQVAPQDLAGPQAPIKPTPRLNGNVINLKELGKE